MKVEVYDKLLENVEEFEKQKITLRSSHEIVVSEVTEARSNLSNAVDTGQTKEVLEAQARLFIAEEKLRKTPVVDSGPKMPKGAETAFNDVRVAISTLKGQGAFIGELQPLLDELGELRSRYVTTLTTLLKKKEQVNNNLAAIHHKAKAIQEKYTGTKISLRDDRPPCAFSIDEFRRWIWIENDYLKEFNRIQDKLFRESNPVPPVRLRPDKMVLPEKPLVTQGQRIIDSRNIPTSGLKILGKAPLGHYTPLGGD